jgi:hypothetical protein
MKSLGGTRMSSPSTSRYALPYRHGFRFRAVRVRASGGYVSTGQFTGKTIQ